MISIQQFCILNPFISNALNNINTITLDLNNHNLP